MFEEDYHADKVYLNILKNVMHNGIKRKDRTGTGTISLFGVQSKYKLTEGFPLLTTKKVYTRGVTGELLFFLNGVTNNNWLSERKVRIWDEWADKDGDLGPIYGFQWRHFGAEYDASGVTDGVDQISNVLKSIRENPFSRRHIVSAWNPQQIEEMALPPCHTMFQFYVTPDMNGDPWGLSCLLYQRSADLFLGVPFNIASYAMLTHLFADLTGLIPLEFVHSIGDAHIYLNHTSQVAEQLYRGKDLRPMPTLKINSKGDDFSQYNIEDFVFEGYDPHPVIKAEVSV